MEEGPIESAHPFNGGTLLRRDVHHLRARWDRAILIVAEVSPKDLRECFRVLREELREAGVRLGELLDDRLRERRVLHHDLAQVLDLRVVHERGEVRACTRARSRRTRCAEPRDTRARPRSGMLLLLLLGELEEVGGLRCGWLRGGGRLGRGRLGSGSRWLSRWGSSRGGRCDWLIEVGRNTLGLWQV